MAVIWAALIKLPRPVWGSLAVIAILAITYTLGAQNKAAEIADKDRKEYHETVKRIDHATDLGGDVDAARERLRRTFGPWPGDM